MSLLGYIQGNERKFTIVAKGGEVRGERGELEEGGKVRGERGELEEGGKVKGRGGN